MLELDYTYGEVVSGVLDAARNNGNVQSQTITIPGLATPFVQSYGYDALNRLKSAEEKAGAATTWRQVYSYDRYGNRNFAQGTTSPDYSQTPNDPATGLPADPARNPVFDTSNNRISVTAAGQSTYSYDAAGRAVAARSGGSYSQVIWIRPQEPTTLKGNNLNIGTGPVTSSYSLDPGEPHAIEVGLPASHLGVNYTHTWVARTPHTIVTL